MAKRTRAAAPPAAEREKRVYIGPSIPYGTLRTAMVLEGTEAEREAFLAEYAEQYPELRYLLVKPAELSEALAKVERKDNILNKYYGDMMAKCRVSRKG